jgi:fumarylacetoacetase
MFEIIDPRRRSFVEMPPDTDFPLQNLPYGVFSEVGDQDLRVGVAIGDMVLDLAVLEAAGLLPVPAGMPVFAHDSLERFAALGRPAWRATRAAIAALLDADESRLRDDVRLRARALLPRTGCVLHLPFRIGGYTDFYACEQHVINCSRALGRQPEVPVNWRHLPLAYNGRASTVVVSGTPIVRPHGQVLADDGSGPVWRPTRKLDFELETAWFVGRDSRMGEPVSADAVADHAFGLVLMNDWSARDIQRWESTPLGPFQGKAFATSISPWVVTLDALEPFRVPAVEQEPLPLPYLRETDRHSYAIALHADLRAAGASRVRVAEARYDQLYWSIGQQLAHQTSSGCSIRIGDLIGSGTISGEARASRGCLLEATEDGRFPLRLPDGLERGYLADGDELVLGGSARRGDVRIGFGEVSGRVLAALRQG